MRGITRSTLVDFEVVPKRVEHAPEAFDVIHRANGYPVDPVKRERHTGFVAQQLERFAEGQFVAVVREGGRERVVGTSTTLRTARAPTEPPLPWREAIGDYGIPTHDPDGAWLYGVEIAVHPAFQRRGIASALYRTRLGLVEELDLAGWYAGGMLMGYHRYADRLSPRAYAEQVIEGTLEDPTVSMQMRRGLVPTGILEGYYREPKAGDCAVLLTWTPRALRDAAGAVHAKPVPAPIAAQAAAHKRAVRGTAGASGAAPAKRRGSARR
jgi:GNAT superfamily N-acetyltransferase